MRRIVVLGTSGCGKTTFAAALSARLNIPSIELDALHWGPNWTGASAEVFRNHVIHATAGESWIIDGNYSVVRDIVWGRADTLIWLDYSMTIVSIRVLGRTLRRCWTAEELWNGNRENLGTQFFSRDSLFLWVIKSWRSHRRDYPKLLRAHTYQGKRVIRLRKPVDADRWLLAANSEPDPSYKSTNRMSHR